jgi:hypothetical protein
MIIILTDHRGEKTGPCDEPDRRDKTSFGAQSDGDRPIVIGTEITIMLRIATCCARSLVGISLVT